LDEELEHIKIELVNNRNFISSVAFKRHLDSEGHGCFTSQDVQGLLEKHGFDSVDESEIEALVTQRLSSLGQDQVSEQEFIEAISPLNQDFTALML
jgi:Ca2+-binding EF-hand superfamily protein